MKKSILKITTLSLLIALGSVACSTSSEVADLSTKSDTKPSASGSPSIPTPSTPTPSTPDAIPELPPAVSTESILEAAHENYAEYSRVDFAKVQTCWKEAGDHALEDFSKSVDFFNYFLKFAFCADPEISSQLAYTKGLVKKVHETFEAKGFEEFWESTRKLTLNNREIKKRILEAVKIYGVRVSDLRPDDSSAAVQGLFVSSLILKLELKGAIKFPDKEKQDQLNFLFESVTLMFNPPEGTCGIFSFETFSSPKDLMFPLFSMVFPFEIGQGGFGVIDSDQVRFVN